jgi:hypothetical protein
MRGVVKYALAVFLAFLVVGVAAAPDMPAAAPDIEPVLILAAPVTGLGIVVVQRHNGEVWVFEAGIGCPSLWLFDGRIVFVISPSGFFGGIGSRILIPDRNQSCPIMRSKPIGRLC